ncbi:unannotated protein [freshwater metagenome]|uniref:Unannotated protein n=1 Tax=freshwater metagenome TaxID=449393 RepID=A0A6J7RJM8_9ZZZZ|nr:hypothetical protein [Actinomycetota bacterium]MSX15206.1 hypothetical protein [Actinomycetota bacterium]MSZ72195.1 hypothetical protein [Actinomycetota bacterium]MUH57269.1 hypothetical protein [Actinomycetota bacterium]
MKRRYVLPTLAILMTPIALSSSPLLASGGDSHENETESTEVPRSSVPRQDRPRSSVPPTTIPTTEDDDSETSNSVVPSTSEPKRRRTNNSSTTSIPSDTIVALPSNDSGSETGDDSSDDSSDDNQSESPEDDHHDSEHRHDDLAKNIARATTALNALPQSEARDAALEALAALQIRLDAGEVIPAAEVRAVFANVATLVYTRIGGENPENETPEIGHVRDDQQLPRQLAQVTEALRLLDGNASDAAVAAIAALQEVKAILDAGTLPDHDVFEAAMELAKDALRDHPAARASLTLAGVIAAVQASDAPAAVKEQLLTILRAAQDQVLNDPTVDARQVVRDALQQVRDARIASAVGRIIAIVDRLEPQANEQGNSDALLLLAQVRSLVQPSDGSQPTRDQLHEARQILHDVLDLLGPGVTPTTTVAL